MIADINTIQPLAPIGPAFPQTEFVPAGTEPSEDDLPAAFGANQSQLQSLIDQYKLQELSLKDAQAKLSEAKIKLGEIVAEAKSKLRTKEEFAVFCKAVGLEPKSSECRKLLKIGQRASRFDLYPERIPQKWTTRYKLATLEDEEYDQVLADPTFNAESTGPDIERILGQSPKTKKPPTEPVRFTINLDEIDKEARQQFRRKLLTLMEEFGLKAASGEEIDALFIDVEQTVA